MASKPCPKISNHTDQEVGEVLRPLLRFRGGFKWYLLPDGDELEVDPNGGYKIHPLPTTTPAPLNPNLKPNPHGNVERPQTPTTGKKSFWHKVKDFWKKHPDMSLKAVIAADKAFIKAGKEAGFKKGYLLFCQMQ